MSTGLEGGCGRDTAGRCIVQALNGSNVGWYLAGGASGGWIRVAEFARVFNNKGHAKSALRYLHWHGPTQKPTRFKIIQVKLEIIGTPEEYSVE
jgi:hypothetical protein